VRITEPMTLITDYAMGALCLVLAVRLADDPAAGSQLSGRLWAAALAMTALGSFVGGTYHGFLDRMSEKAGHVVWRLTQAAAGLGSACLLAAAVVATATGPVRSALLVLVGVKLLVYLWSISTRESFTVVIVDYGSALVAILIAAWLVRPGGLAPAAWWLTAGVGVSALAGYIQWARVAPSPRFNHNDLFHVVQMTALYLLYRGGLLMRDMQ
jgi:hypothetical protein